MMSASYDWSLRAPDARRVGCNTVTGVILVTVTLQQIVLTPSRPVIDLHVAAS